MIYYKLFLIPKSVRPFTKFAAKKAKSGKNMKNVSGRLNWLKIEIVQKFPPPSHPRYLTLPQFFLRQFFVCRAYKIS